MSERRYSIMIGAFLVGGLLIALAVALFIGGAGYDRNARHVVMAFDGSIKGLTIGAPVALRGVRVGQVTDIDLLIQPDAAGVIMQVVATLSGDNVRFLGANDENLTERLVERGLRAQLNLQSLLTGMLYVQLDFNSELEPLAVELDSEYLQIPTIPTELEQLRDTLESIDYRTIANDIHAITRSLSTLLGDEQLRRLPARLADTLVSLEGLAERLDGTLARLEPGAAGLLARSDAVLEGLQSALPGLLEESREGVQELRILVSTAEATLAQTASSLGPGSASQVALNQTLEELRLATRSLRNLSQTLAEQPDALLRGRRALQP